MSRWSPAPRILDDPNDPLYQQFLAIPSPGDGLNLTPIQLCILFRRSPAERHTRASEVFGRAYLNNTSGGLIKSRLRNSPIINNITNQHLQAVGMTRAQIPRFASGGTAPRPRRRAAMRPAAPVRALSIAPVVVPAMAPVVNAGAIVPAAAILPAAADAAQSEASTGLFVVAWEPNFDGPNFKAYLDTLDISGMVHFGTKDSTKYGVMEVNPIGMGWASFVGQVKDTIERMPGFRELRKDSRFRFEKVELRYYADEDFEVETKVAVVPMVRNKTVRHRVMDVVVGVMSQLPRDYFMVAVGLEFNQ
ncbi:hypothetical protein IFR04_013413 [Cadophora malorum]|uniref:Uncharacterized protein n=1 Tax=Cadophora malorum TaxID=108018 RepID=A0A8H7T709_9HELO|nr:hypothetical protein IFR04_013413 [Cadophora malorum]